MSNYNYHKFSADYYEFGGKERPKVGKKVEDFDFYDLDGKKVKLSDYLDKPVLLETGSVTCPLYCNRIANMNKMALKFDPVRFLVVYVREAHPGMAIGGHMDRNEKLERAKLLKRVEPEGRTVLVDDLNGSVHRKLGGLPNMVYLIDRDRRVRFASDWNEEGAVELKLTMYLGGYDPTEVKFRFSPTNPLWAVKVMLRGGVDAIYHFIVEIPKLLVLHRQKHS